MVNQGNMHIGKTIQLTVTRQKDSNQVHKRETELLNSAEDNFSFYFILQVSNSYISLLFQFRITVVSLLIKR